MMLRAAHARQLCSSCRLSLLRYFEDSFSTYSQHRFRRVPRFSGRTNLVRQFSSHHVRFSVRPNDDNATEDQPSADVEVRGGHISTVKNDAIDLLEQELGMSLGEAMKHDRAAVEALLEKMATQGESGLSLEAGDDPLQTMRNDGAKQADVVREARNIFGDYLPENVLSDEEFVLYRRLYGNPSPDADEQLDHFEDDADNNLDQVPQNALYSADGNEIEYTSNDKQSHLFSTNDEFSSQDDDIAVDEIRADGPLDSHLRARRVAESVGGQLVEDDSVEDFDDQEGDFSREHPLTTLGKFSTSPKTIFLPTDEFVRPVEKLMGNFSNKHLKEMCERTFGGPGLPDSPLTPRSGRFKQQIPIPLEAGQSTMGEMEANSFVTAFMPPTYASILSVLVETRKRLGISWLTQLLTREDGPRVLDASAGGAGIIAWREMVKAQWDAIHSSDPKPPPVPTTKSVVVTGSDALRHRAADLLENTTFVPRLPDYVHTRGAPTLEDDRPAQQRKQFDVIIAPHSLFPLKEEWMRKQHVQNLWSLLNPDGGILILIEKGMPRGFEALAGAREMLLERYIAIPSEHQTHYSSIADDSMHKKETAMIVAPCTNHERCPMYTVPGFSRGRRDICSFQQRYIRPPFLQRILGAGDRNHDDVDFSYLSIMKGDDLRSRHPSDWSHIKDPISSPVHSTQAESYTTWLEKVQKGFEDITPEESNSESAQILPAMHQLPRAILPPIKRKGHVSLDVCTPAGKIERWTIPRSFSRQAYRDARKSRWGDLWALGAKTRTPRNLSLGTSQKDLTSKKKGEAKGRERKDRSVPSSPPNGRDQEGVLAETEVKQETSSGIDFDNKKRRQSTISSPPTPPHKSKSKSKSKSTSMSPSMSEDDITQILSEWQSEYDEISSTQRKQTRRLNKLDKKKIKKELRTQYNNTTTMSRYREQKRDK